MKKQNSNFIFVPIVIILILFSFYIGRQSATMGQVTGQPTLQPVATSDSQVGLNSAPPTQKVRLKSYASNSELVTFQYPENWVSVKPPLGSSDPQGDAISLRSPSGTVQIDWVSSLSGFGGGCDPKATLGIKSAELSPCPLHTVIDKVGIKGAQGLFVVSGTSTDDGKNYEPWFRVQDKDGVMTTQRSMGQILFRGRNNGRFDNGKNITVTFTASVPYAGNHSVTMLQSEIIAYFNKPEVQQAKDILLSLTY